MYFITVFSIYVRSEDLKYFHKLMRLNKGKIFYFSVDEKGTKSVRNFFKGIRRLSKELKTSL